MPTQTIYEAGRLGSSAAVHWCDTAERRTACGLADGVLMLAEDAEEADEVSAPACEACVHRLGSPPTPGQFLVVTRQSWNLPRILLWLGVACLVLGSLISLVIRSG